MKKISTERLIRVYVFVSFPLVVLLAVASVFLYMGQRSANMQLEATKYQLSSLSDNVSGNFSGVFHELDNTQHSIDNIQSSVDFVCKLTASSAAVC